ncbi:MAG: M67 family metallopeptidase [Paracoccaceae bacterium]
MDLIVTSSVLDLIVREAARAAPSECCGILYAERGTVTAAEPAANVADNPRTRFEIAPQALIDAHRSSRRGGMSVAGYFHSHPQGPAAPSATDRTEAAHDRAIWAIAAGGDVTFWRDDEFGFTPLSYNVVDR